VDVEPARGDAHLAVVAELADDRGLRPRLRVGVGEDDERLPAQLRLSRSSDRSPHELLPHSVDR
jgi:hypothetical protein